MAVGMKVSVVRSVLRYFAVVLTVGAVMLAIVAGIGGLYYLGRLVGLGDAARVPATVFGVVTFLGLGGRLLVCALEALE